VNKSSLKQNGTLFFTTKICNRSLVCALVFSLSKIKPVKEATPFIYNIVKT